MKAKVNVIKRCVANPSTQNMFWLSSTTKQEYTVQLICKDQQWNIPSSLAEISNWVFVDLKIKLLKDRTALVVLQVQQHKDTWSSCCWLKHNFRQWKEEPWNIGRFEGLKCAPIYVAVDVDTHYLAFPPLCFRERKGRHNMCGKKEDLPEPLFDTTFRQWTTTAWSRIRRGMGAFIFYQSYKETKKLDLLFRTETACEYPSKTSTKQKNKKAEIMILAGDAQSRLK